MAPWDRRHPCRQTRAGRDAGGPRTHAPLQTMPSEIALVPTSRADLDEVAVEGALAGQVGQGIRGGPVDVAAVGRARGPIPLGRDGDARRDVVGDYSPQRAPTARVLDDHAVAVSDAAGSGVTGVDLDV